MEVNHLKSNELSYELEIRGVSFSGTVEEKRHLLRGVFAQEKKGIVNIKEKSCFKFEDDIQGAIETVTDLKDIIVNFSGHVTESVYDRIVSRLNHVTKRLQRFDVKTESDRKEQSELYTQILTLEGEVAEKIELASGLSHTSFTMLPNTTRMVSPNPNYVPPYKWNVQFSGSGPRESVNAFLEKIESSSNGAT